MFCLFAQIENVTNKLIKNAKLIFKIWQAGNYSAKCKKLEEQKAYVIEPVLGRPTVWIGFADVFNHLTNAGQKVNFFRNDMLSLKTWVIFNWAFILHSEKKDFAIRARDSINNFNYYSTISKLFHWIGQGNCGQK